mgnify:CR=1 FL=1
MSRRRPTLAEVARQAGVSVSTVSKVVNGHLDVSDETRRQVELLLEQHQYRPRRSPGRQPVGLIDLVFQDLDNSWAMQILGGVEQVAHEQGIGVVVSAVHDDRSRPGRRWLDNVRARSSDGVVLVLSGALMISTLPTWSFKNFKVPSELVLPLLLGVGVYVAVLLTEPWAALAAAGPPPQ